MYWPGTMRRQPDLPKVSWWILEKTLRSLLYSKITILPESPARMMYCFSLPIVPASEKGIRALMTPKTFDVQMICIFPFSSGLSSSSTLPRETTISCVLGPEKLPYMAVCMTQNLGKVFIRNANHVHAMLVLSCARAGGCQS